MRNDFLIDTESACIVLDEVVVKTANRTWVHRSRPAESGDRFAGKMVGTGRAATNRKLLDGAVALAY